MTIKRLVPGAVGLLSVLIVLVVMVTFYRDVTHLVQCDGSLPVWMLERQDYDGGGCARGYPTHAAPSDADWTQYCMALCDGPPAPWPPEPSP